MTTTTTIKSSYWKCDLCRRTLIHGEFRFTCIVCYDYDLCDKCVTTIDPPHPHQMIRDLAYGEEEIQEGMHKFSLATGIQLAAAMYCDRYCLGVREIDPADPAKYTDAYSWLTYKTVDIRTRNFGHGLRTIIEPRDYLAICAENRPEWVITDFACILQSIISVPIYCLFNDSELSYVINNTKISVVVCDGKNLPRFIRLSTECPSLCHIVCMDPVPQTISGTKNHNLRIHYMGDIGTCGSEKQYDLVTIEPNECLTIIYTSGSSGFPKGAIVSEATYLATLSHWCSPASSDLISFCYEPLAWASDRDSVMRTFFRGGRTIFSSGDVSRLIEDLALARPNNFSATPAVWNKLYSEYKVALSLATAHLPSEEIEAEENRLLQEFSTLIPSRCKTITVGGAMISPAVFEFIKRCFTRCEVYESYGITECGSITQDNLIDSMVPYRLEPVPEMGYTADELCPRGELVIMNAGMCSGYINNPEETQAAFTEDGYFRTGDIVELRKDSKGRTLLYVIDRKKSFFKLSQGQYVSPEFLQSIYIQSPFVEQIYIHGDLLADSVSAVVVPNREYANAFVVEHKLENFDMKNPDPQFYDAIRRDLCRLAEKESLRKHEIPSRIVIDFEPFTPENGLLTCTTKPCRYKLAAHYGDRLKQSNTIEQKLKTIIETTTGQSLLTDDQDDLFIPTGGDSLTAVRLSRTIEKNLGVSVPISTFLKPNITLQQLATVINDPSQISSMFQSIAPQLLNDSQLDLNIKVGERRKTITTPSMIFVTGTTGFVGAFLLAELLSVYPAECKFICLVRCESTINPLDRIRQTMLFYQIWREDFQNRIVAMQGDLAKRRFGLDIESYESLANQIDSIFHCGAVVNFVLPYSTLYDSNVSGTREVIRLAAHTSTCIPIHYISTTSVLSSDVKTEVSIDHISPHGLVDGYAQSKWVAEKLIIRASQLGLPVVIYRLGSICASTKTGACNRNDFHTLLLAAMIKTNSYPKTLIHARLFELPVDFTAKSIVYLSNVHESDIDGQIYHVLNPTNEISFADIIASISRCDVQLEGVSLEEWRIRLKAISDQENLFQCIGEFLHENNTFEEKCQISAEQFYHSISTLHFPYLDNAYVMKWLAFILEHIVRSS